MIATAIELLLEGGEVEAKQTIFNRSRLNNGRCFSVPSGTSSGNSMWHAVSYATKARQKLRQGTGFCETPRASTFNAVGAVRELRREPEVALEFLSRFRRTMS